MGIDQIIARNRRLQLLIDEKMRSLADRALLDRIKAYLDDYIAWNRLDENAVWSSYERFLGRYLSDVQLFLASGRYPLESNAPPAGFSRIDYDLALMLSVVCAHHRYRIMELLAGNAGGGGHALVIGSGSGLEIELVGRHHRQITAYDLEVNPFCRERHPSVTFHEREFRDDPARYQAIYLIELLEHVAQPFELLRPLAGSLAAGGRMLLTTASNVPQFDHAFNFRDVDVRAALQPLGLTVTYREEIPHASRNPALQASNGFYVATRA